MTTSNRARRTGSFDLSDDIATSPGRGADKKRQRQLEVEASVVAHISFSDDLPASTQPDSPSVGRLKKRQYSAQDAEAATTANRLLSKSGSASGPTSQQASAVSLDFTSSPQASSKASTEPEAKLRNACEECTSPERRIQRAAVAFPCQLQPFEVGTAAGLQAAVQRVNTVVQQAAKTKRRQRAFRHGMRTATLEGEPFPASPQVVKDVPEASAGPAEEPRPCTLHCLATNGVVAPITLTSGTGRGTIRVSRMVTFN